MVTVSAPDNTPDTTPTITGTTDVPPGSTVTVVVTDNGGKTQTLTGTVQPDGSYSVTPTTPLVEGPYTAEASVTDPADYAALLGELSAQGGTLGFGTRLCLMKKAFEHTAQYDSAIAAFFAGVAEDTSRSTYQVHGLS